MRRDKPIYPPEWKAMSHFVRFVRAGGRCECHGQCGLHRTHPGPRRCVEVHKAPAQWAGGEVILTTAHLCDCDPLCAEPLHLLACCQRCHIRIDIPLHQQHAAETRRLAKELAGQTSFFREDL